MTKKVLLATDKAFAGEAVLKIQNVFDEAKYELVKLENYKSKDDLLSAVAEVDAMIIRSDIVDATVVEAAKQLKICVRAGAGYDNIDLQATKAKGICCMNTPGQNANAVAELVFGMMLVSARNNFDGNSGFEITGRSIAFYGFGAVALAVHKLCQGFGMKVSAYDPFLTDEQIQAKGATPLKSIAELFKSQYVSLHVPLTEDKDGVPGTRNSINKALLAQLPAGGTLINTARQEVVNEAELLEVLKERPDFCYLSDVAPKNVAEVKELVGDKFGKRVIFTAKKMGAQTLEANTNAGVAAAHQIVGFFERGDRKFELKE